MNALIHNPLAEGSDPLSIASALCPVEQDDRVIAARLRAAALRDQREELRGHVRRLQERQRHALTAEEAAAELLAGDGRLSRRQVELQDLAFQFDTLVAEVIVGERQVKAAEAEAALGLILETLPAHLHLIRRMARVAQVLADCAAEEAKFRAAAEAKGVDCLDGKAGKDLAVIVEHLQKWLKATEYLLDPI